jgi:hypothetical protein
MGFDSLQHMQDAEVHLLRARPPAAFRLQGLATLLTAYSPRSLAGFVSHRRRSWDLPFGAFSSRKVSGAFPPGRTHLPFRPAVYLMQSIRPARQATVSGFCPFRKSLAAHMCLARDPLVAPLGFALLGFPARALAGFRPTSSHVVEPFGSHTSEYQSALAQASPIPAASRGRRTGHPF